MAVCEKCGRAHTGKCQYDMPWLGHPCIDLVGAQIGGYEVLEEIARGGMGVIYRARHRLIGALAAVKVLRPELVSDQSAVERFVEEARAQARVRHPNTVQVYDLTNARDGRPCIIMELVEGDTLEKRLANGPLPPAQALPILVQVCNGLAAAHAAGIVHRDVKAENVLLMHRYGRTDFVKVLDFSVAKFSAAASPSMTSPGTVLGTPYYMAPEQAMGKAVDGRSDVYAVGVLAFRMLTGQFPFEGETAAEVMIKQVRDPPPDVPGAPAGVRAVLARALAKNPDDRFATMADLAQAFRSCAPQIAATITSSGIHAVPAVRPTPVPAAAPAPAKRPPPSAVERPPAQARPQGAWQGVAPAPAPAAAAAPAAEGPSQQPVRVRAEPGRLHLQFASAEVFAKLEKDELAQGRLFVPCTVPVPLGRVEVTLEAPGRVPASFDAVVSMNVGEEQARAWGMRPGFGLSLPYAPLARAGSEPARPAAAAAEAPKADLPPEGGKEVRRAPPPLAEGPRPGHAAARGPPRAPPSEPPPARQAEPAPAPEGAPPALQPQPQEAPEPLDEVDPPAPGGPATEEEIRQLVEIYELRRDGDFYSFIGQPPEADASEIAAACRRMGAELQRIRLTASGEALSRIDALLSHLAEVRRVLRDPPARAAYDAGRGNFQGVARALRAGLSAAQLATLHEAFAARFPQRAERAAAAIPEIDKAIQGRDRMRALHLIDQALALDPLSPALQQRYLALRAPPSLRK